MRRNIFVLNLVALATVVSARHAGAGLRTSTRWGLPPLPSDESSLASFVASVPRGGQRDYDYYDGRDDRYNEDPDDYYWGEQRRPAYYDDDAAKYEGKRGMYSGAGRSYVEEPGPASPFAALLNKIKNGDRRIGAVLLVAGLVSTIMGVSLFFNKTLMRLGNLLFIAGVPMTIGPGRTMGYFVQPKKARATACLALGIILVFVGWPIVGIVFEVFGLMNLFGNLFPVALAIMKQMPVIGPMLESFGNGSSGGSSSSRRKKDDDYYNDQRYYDDRGYYGNQGGDYRDDRDDGYY